MHELSDTSESTALSGTSEEDPPDDKKEELAAFDAKLSQALGIHIQQKICGDEMSSSSGEGMDDEQMERLDGHLESMFRERKKLANKRTEHRDAKENIISFKCRVLELLGVFIRHEHTSVRALGLVLPILSLIRRSSSPLVTRKACDLIREYVRLCKRDGLPVMEKSDSALDMLRSVHAEAGKDGSKAHEVACSQVSLLLVRILVAQDREHLRDIVGVYAHTQERLLFDVEFQVRPPFFTEWLNWCHTARK